MTKPKDKSKDAAIEAAVERRRGTIDPATQAILEAFPYEPQSDDEVAEDERLEALSRVYADEVMIRGILPKSVEVELYDLLIDTLMLFPILSELLKRVSEGLPARRLEREERPRSHEVEPLHVAALRMGAHASAVDYLMGIRPPKDPSREAAEQMIVEEALGIVAAFVTGAAAACARLASWDRLKALSVASGAVQVVAEHVVTMGESERLMFEATSMRLHEHPRDPGMNVPARDVLLQHHASMKKLGKALAGARRKATEERTH